MTPPSLGFPITLSTITLPLTLRVSLQICSSCFSPFSVKCLTHNLPPSPSSTQFPQTSFPILPNVSLFQQVHVHHVGSDTSAFGDSSTTSPSSFSTGDSPSAFNDVSLTPTEAPSTSFSSFSAGKSGSGGGGLLVSLLSAASRGKVWTKGTSGSWHVAISWGLGISSTPENGRRGFVLQYERMLLLEG